MSCATRHGSLRRRLLPENHASQCANPAHRAKRQHDRRTIKCLWIHRIAAIKRFAKRKGREMPNAGNHKAPQRRQLKHLSVQLIPSEAKKKTIRQKPQPPSELSSRIPFRGEGSAFALAVVPAVAVSVS